MSVKHNDNEVVVSANAMMALITEIFMLAGCEPPEAERISTRLTGANLRGHDSHGVIRTPRYVEWLRKERVIANTGITVEKDTDTLAIINGNYGFGQTVGEQTVDIGIAKAKQVGISVTALKNAGHLGRIGDWAERAAAENIASMHMVNVRGSLLVAPFGGVDRRGSTSPFCMGVPLEGEAPVILDFATSLVAEGKALVALRGGKALPQGALIDAQGELTNDPTPLYGETEAGSYPDPNKGPGALTGFGAHKGSGLNFFMEMMAGALTGSGTCAGTDENTRRRFCNGMLSVYFAVDSFHQDHWFSDEVKSYIAFYKSSRPAVGHEAVLIPGEKERQLFELRSETGLPLPVDTWRDILDAAHSVGMEDTQLTQILGVGYAG